MTPDPEPRPYRKQERARKEEGTRRRITEAVVKLHGTVGPVNTKITDVARLAGVTRMTVYNHFPREADLIEACSAHWAAANPFPDPTTWAELPGPARRLSQGLTELYEWYADTADMVGNVLRDAPNVEPLDMIVRRRWRPYLEEVVGTLGADWKIDASEESNLHAALHVAVDFNTWRALQDSLGNAAAAARLATRMVEGALGADAD